MNAAAAVARESWKASLRSFRILCFRIITAIAMMLIPIVWPDKTVHGQGSNVRAPLPGLNALKTGGADPGLSIADPLTPVVRLPEAGSTVLGFTSSVTVGQQSIAGYLPVEIQIDAVGRFNADRRFTYRFTTRGMGQSPPRNGLQVDVPVNVAQNDAGVRVVRYLPKWSAGQAIEVIVLEDGQPLAQYRGLVSQNATPGFQPNVQWVAEEMQTNWLLLGEGDDEDQTAVAELQTLMQPNVLNETWQAVAGGSRNQTVTIIPPNRLPGDWRAYQRYDAIFVRPAGLERLTKDPQALQAFRHWVMSGGTAVMLQSPQAALPLKTLGLKQVDDEAWTRSLSSTIQQAFRVWEQSEKDIQAEIQRTEQDRDLLIAQEESAAVLAAGTLPSSPRAVPPTPQSPQAIQMGMMATSPRMMGMSASTAEEATAWLEVLQSDLQQIQERPLGDALQWSDRFWIHPAGMGAVIGVATDTASGMPSRAELQILASYLSYRVSPMLRRGVDPILGDGRFSRWMIPGVAQPPVYTFMGLLSVFVVLVGPVAYRKTSRAGRSYLMFAIAPVLALMTTLAMFGYGIVADGFGTQLRARQLTFVDSASGDAMERTRSTYFAGLRPREGLRFDGSAEVMMYPQSNGQTWAESHALAANIMGRVVVQPDQQRFSSSFLPARQQTQFVVHQPRPDLGHLQLIAGTDSSMTPTMVNAFEFPLQQVVARDADGLYWLTANLAASSKAVCESLQVNEASKALGQMYNDHRPISSVRESNSDRNRNRYRPGNPFQQDIFDLSATINQELQNTAVMTDGLFEHWLQQHLQLSGDIPPNYFVAITQISDDVVAVEGTQVVQSVRYVFGTLK